MKHGRPGRSAGGGRAVLPPGAGEDVGQIRPLLPLHQVADELVGYQKALGRQTPAPLGGLLRPALGLELCQPPLQ